MALKESDSQIEKLIRDELVSHFKEVLNASQYTIADSIQTVVISSIRESDEYEALRNGKLVAQFGLTETQAKLDAILAEWTKQLEVDINGTTLTVGVIKRDLADVLSLAEAKQITEKGEPLEWLDWLLTQGDKTIIKDYQISLDPKKAARFSRTGLALMVRGKKWSVPSEFAGTKNKNWVTRVIDHIPDSVIERIIISAIEAKW